MAAAMNGMALHGGVRPAGGTFLVFSDYARPAIRIAALAGIPVVYVMTHDSIGLGEDGPTHQPVEHLAALRALPNLRVFRPADAIETAECWQLALERKEGPSLLALTRQNLPPLPREAGAGNACARGAYEVSPAPEKARATLFATGSEVEIALSAQARLAERGYPVRVVSVPSLDLFLSQPEAVRREVIGDAPDEGRGRGGGALRLGRADRAGRNLRRHEGIRGERALQGPVPPFRHHAGGGGGRGAAHPQSMKAEPHGGARRFSRSLPVMTVKVAINGFGRIGRNILRAIVESGRNDIEVVAINDLAPVETNAHLLRFDSVHGRFPSTVETEAEAIVVDGKRIRVTAIKNPAELPHRELGVDIALECTGIFTSKEKAKAHLEAGAKRVIVSAPAEGADLTVVYGVNHDKLAPEHLVVSNASCTTNCLAPVAKVLNDAIGIEKGFMTTIHSYTNDQPSLDQVHKDLYRARAAALSMIPTSTGAAKAVGLVLPELNGKLDGTSIRVPTPNVSVIDFKFIAKRETSKDEVNGAVKRAAEQQLKGVLGTTDQPNVSIDFNHDPHSSIFHLDQTKVMDGTLVRVMSWYDNEWGFSNRMADTAVAMGKLL
jgi:glyceraldehyde 3-phosphate dehydrogenase